MWAKAAEKMIESGIDYVSPDQLRRGLYIDLELGWMSHPFPTSSFKISTDRQIETIRSLGLKRVRFVPSRSDPPSTDEAPEATHPAAAAVATDAAQAPVLTPEQAQRAHTARLLDAQRRSLAQCDQQFGAASRHYQAVLEQVHKEPAQAARHSQEMVAGVVEALMGNGESAIRLLSDGMGDRVGMHPVNVTVLCLLLGKALGLGGEALRELGCAAFLHDVGKSAMAERVRLQGGQLPHDEQGWQEHVALGVGLGSVMGLPEGVLRAIAEHHEQADGSGYPNQLRGGAMSMPGCILGLVNRYENLCNPARPSSAVTPHEALALIFSRMQACFEAPVLAAFIRMMGVYPPGSVVQLGNERYALVVSVNSTRPLKPRVIVHEPAVPPEQALILDLEQEGAPGIRRSIKPAALPRAAMDYLSPRSRICYFFERAMPVLAPGAAA